MTRKISLIIARILGFALAIICLLVFFGENDLHADQRPGSNGMTKNDSFLIDDFTDAKGRSLFGSQWRMFSDRVMGGVSTGSSAYETLKGRNCLRLRGSVSLENNGGFIQVALSLVKGNNYFDAAQFKGVRLWVLGNGETYYVHLRSNQTRRPWQYYGAPFKTSGEWQKIDIPFGNFKPESLDVQLDTSRLARIAVVAIKKKFKADIAISRLEFYQ
jgi:hypothetical protein